MILGMPWLERHNPSVDWKTKTITLPDKDRGCSINRITQVINFMKTEEEESIVDIRSCLVEEHEDIVLALIDHEDPWIKTKVISNYLDAEEAMSEETAWVCVKQTHSQRLAQQAESRKKDTGKKAELPPKYSDPRNCCDVW